MGFDVFSLDAANHAESANKKANLAANAAGANLDASILMLQMMKEMRDFQHRRFNDVAAGFHKVYDKIDEQNEEIKNLHKKIAELQAQLYQEQEKNKGFAR